MVIILYLIAWLLKYLDTFALRLDELVGEAILTKALGLLLVFLFLRWTGRRMKDIGFHTRDLGKSLILSALVFVLVYVIALIVQMLVFNASGENAKLVIKAVDPKTGMTGGLLFGIWMFIANLINSAMEEGLFRGVMMRQLMLKMSGWGAILISAGFFAIWHLGWPLRHYLDGTSTLGEAGFEAFSLMLATFIAGVAYGYLYFKTGNLWAPFLGHTINNTLLNVLFFQTDTGLQGAPSSMIFMPVVLVGYLISLPCLKLIIDRWNAVEVTAWES